MQSSKPRALFTTRIGAIATTVGSAVGLGNIWRFPYEAGTHGGGAFMICYIAFIFVLGIPLLTAEYILGRATRSNEIKTFKKLAPHTPWFLTGYIGLLASLLILSFYSVVAGWTLEFFFASVTGQLPVEHDAIHANFTEFITGDLRPLMWTLIFLAINYFIVSRGVQKGIEKISNLLTPLLFLLLVIFCINSLLLPGASEGLSFLFNPDFSKLDSRALLGAMGQAFFSLSLGLGCMMTYASYFPKSTHLGRTAAATALLDTAIAILAGVIIFPAVFTYGISPEAGPTLVFETLPAIFMNLPGGIIWAALFFFLLFLASITSTISMSEISIAYFTEELHMGRRAATALCIGIAMVFGALCALSFGSLSDMTVCGKTIFEAFDYLSSNICLPLGGMLIAIFTGWKLNREIAKVQLTNNSAFRFRLYKAMMFSIKYIAPAAIMLIFLNSLGLV